MELGWIDFSKEDRDKVFDVINLLQEKGAVDELGIGIVRNAFANYFFPGTSTIQTRAKYFLIVPYLLMDAVRDKKTYGNDIKQIEKKIDDEEKQCAIKLLKENPDAEGIIGIKALPNSWVLRTPSNIYWSGIRTLGIFNNSNLSILEYIKASIQLRENKNSRRIGNYLDESDDSDKDDKDTGDKDNILFWNLPTYTTEWRDNLKISLTSDEANYLKSTIIKKVPESIYAYILDNNIDVNKYDSFSSLATALLNSDVSDENKKMLVLAVKFIDLVYMARVRYNVILSDGKNETAVDEWNKLSPKIKSKADVDIDEIFKKLLLNNNETYKFLSKLKEYFINNNIDEADRLIRNREINLKGINRAKLNCVGKFNTDIWIGGKLLDYRFSNVKVIINDIYNGEESIDV